jgi:cellulose synthase/poly-beta-1,6-N-acetylglucosamine synthase-like glycosyltransferase
MHPIENLVQLVFAQSFCFAVSWILAFLVGHRLKRGHWIFSLLVLAALQAAAFAFLSRVQGSAPPFGWWIPAGIIALATIALTEHWNAIGQACLSSTISLSLYFLAYLVHVTARAHLGPLSLAFSLVLLALQTFAILLLCAGSHEMLDVLCRTRWRRVRHPEPVTDWFPRVSLHVPAYNEPPEMVIETLDALARLDYPNYEVIVIDDNTTDERLWRPIEAHCRKLGFKFFHLENWPGFKSGALNFALGKTDPAAEILGVIDSDYLVQPEYLKSCVGFLRDPRMAFVQSPQDYRDVSANDRYASSCYDAYMCFFKISMAMRNEHNGIIFAGTMGLIRRQVLEEVGGWDEWCITEDAELSLRILDRGYEGLYVDHSFGHGLMPLNFEGLKKQRFRWAFGGMQILRRHWGALMPWARWSDPAHRLTFAQQWGYLMGGLQWLNDPITFGFTALLLLGAGSLLLGGSLFIQPLAPAVLFVPFLFIFIGVSRFLWAFRLRMRCSLGRAISAFIIMLGLTWVVTLACVLGLTKKQGVFLRTPKKRSGPDPWHTIRIVSNEATLFSLCLGLAVTLAWGRSGTPQVWVMSGLLLWQSLIYLSAPISSFWGHRSELRVAHPEYLNASRTTGLRFSSMITDRRISAALAAAGLAAVLVFFLAIRLAPEMEQVFRTNPRHVPLVPASLMPTPPETQIKALLFLEKEAAIRGDVREALALWDSGGVIRDAGYTPADTSDDRVWVGLDAIRRRYADEFDRHRYLSLAHSDASVFIENDRAVVVNDLHAVIATPSGVQRVFLTRSDRWTFVRGEQGWRIRELIVNRAPR